MLPSWRLGSQAWPLHLSGEGEEKPEARLPDTTGKEPVPAQPHLGAGSSRRHRPQRAPQAWGGEGVQAQLAARARARREPDWWEEERQDRQRERGRIRRPAPGEERQRSQKVD